MKPPRTETRMMMYPVRRIMGGWVVWVGFFNEPLPCGGGADECFEAEDCLGVDLADAGFRHAENAGDLGEAEVFEIIHGEDFSLHLGEFVEAFDDKLDEFLLEGELGGVRGAFVRHDLVEAGIFILAGERIEFDITDGADFVEEFRVFLGGDAEFLGDFGFGGRAAEFLFDGGDDLGDFLGLDAEGAGHPIDAAEFVENGPADAHGGVAGECDAVGGVETALGLDETEEADGVEILDIDV
jgi:hypothetical protein